MVLHPEVQSKARAELDSVVGHARLPDFVDRDSLPYIDAIVKEALRWNPVAPLGLPHMVTKADEFRGYYIPAGTTIMGNSWTILHDPDTYPEPMVFKLRDSFQKSLRSLTSERRIWLWTAYLPGNSWLKRTFGYLSRVSSVLSKSVAKKMNRVI
ncbi:hypothetical protein E1B28_005898 [Marasmius oreades]|uniref:Cytochrome P450 n=1 Tax=Marasmius oreades TaxID=181124 RepID=A0A9P7S6D0_9AGAR|nr:uncharacterized protein E1B28_005898 [Marasmius oreades]KAG7095113.1 hypothetical protein E1B28_005898 [Marasmius oreades]